MGCSNLSNCQVFDADALELFASMNLSCGVDGTQHNMSAFCYPDREFDPKNPILKMILTSLIFLISLIGNGLLVVLIIRNFSVFSSVNGYLLNLSFADLLITCTCLWPHTISDRHSHYIFWSFLCSTLAVIQGTCVLASVLTLAAVAVERVYAVMLPFEARITPCRFSFVLGVIWVLSLLGAAPFAWLKTFQSDEYCDYIDYQCRPPPCEVIIPVHVYHVIFSALLFFLPLTVLAIAYSLIIYKLSNFMSFGENSGMARNAAQEFSRRKAVVISCTVLVVFICCWGPLQGLLLYCHLGAIMRSGSIYAENDEWVFWATLLGYSNSAFNPIIYAWFSATYRQDLHNMIFRTRNAAASTTGTGSLSLTNRSASHPVDKSLPLTGSLNSRFFAAMRQNSHSQSYQEHGSFCNSIEAPVPSCTSNMSLKNNGSGNTECTSISTGNSNNYPEKDCSILKFIEISDSVTEAKCIKSSSGLRDFEISTNEKLHPCNKKNKGLVKIRVKLSQSVPATRKEESDGCIKDVRKLVPKKGNLSQLLSTKNFLKTTAEKSDSNVAMSTKEEKFRKTRHPQGPSEEENGTYRGPKLNISGKRLVMHSNSI